MRLAGIDCGTNSIRLLIADHSAAGLVDVVREMRVVRLGQGVDRTGRLDAAAIERTRDALVDYVDAIATHGAQRVRMAATSATRDAANREVFVAMVREVLGVDPEVITGEQEAQLSFAGAASALPAASGAMLVVDLGGGSTELVRGGDGPLRSYSMDVGCVRMTERYLHDDPPTPDQVRAVVDDVRAAVTAARVHVALDPDVTVVGVAGTVTTLAAIAHALPRYDAELIHGSILTVAQIHTVTDRLLSMRRDERAALAVMHPGRVDVIGGGALVLRTIVDEIGVTEIVVSEHDILDGLVLSLGAG